MASKFMAIFAAGFLGLAQPAYALSCAQVEGWEEVVPQNELIVRAKIMGVRPQAFIPILQKEEDQDQVITFQILDIYKAPEGMPATFEASFPQFFMRWGPDLKVSGEGEYLFDRKDGEWVFAGPGGCTYYSEKVWDNLRKNKRRP